MRSACHSLHCEHSSTHPSATALMQRMQAILTHLCHLLLLLLLAWWPISQLSPTLFVKISLENSGFPHWLVFTAWFRWPPMWQQLKHRLAYWRIHELRFWHSTVLSQLPSAPTEVQNEWGICVWINAESVFWMQDTEGLAATFNEAGHVLTR